jgi:hypothetical protein
MTVIKYNLRENKQLLARLLTEAPLVSSQADKYPNWQPSEAWTGTYAKYESLLKAMGAKPYPRPFGAKANYEMYVGDDYIRFYDDGTAYSTNNSQEMGYGIDTNMFAKIALVSGTSNKPRLTLYDKPGGEQIHGYIENSNGKLTFIPPAAEDAVKEEPETWVDYLQLALDVVGLIPGFGDIADIINAAISFGRGNYLEGFLSLIGAIPVVGSAIMLPLKVILKTFNRAGDVLKSAWRSKKSADEMWLFVKNSGKLGPAELDGIVKGMGDVSGYIRSFRKEADWALPKSAAGALDEFADFLQKNSNGAEAIFKGAAKTTDAAAGGILRVRKELDQLGGLQKIFGKGLTRRLRNTFSRAISPKELEALRGAMDIKFFKNMDNPGKLTILLKTDPNLATKTLTGITSDVSDWFSKMSRSPRVGNFNPAAAGARLQTQWDNISRTYPGQDAKIMEQQLLFLKKNSPELYSKAHKNIVNMAQESDNPLYKQFMTSEINGLGSYFSKEYTELAGIKSAAARWTNLAPVVYNELSDIGEDALMASGIETKDDVNGLFWPLLKSAVDASKHVPVLGDFVQWTSTNVGDRAGAAAKWAAENPVFGSGITQVKNALGVDTGKPYDPNVKFQIVPDDDPRLKQQELEKEKRIQQNKRF